MTKLAAAIALLGLNFYVYHYFARDPVVPPRAVFADFPLELAEHWTCTPEAMQDDVIENLGVTDYLICSYNHAEEPWIAGVYIGYHETQVREEGGGSGENSIHPPAHCLPGSGWNIIQNESVPLDLPGLPQPGANVKRLLIAKGDLRQLVYYWYQSRGRVIAEDWQKILYVGYDRATRGRTDGALVRFTLPIHRKDEAPAEEAFRSLAPEVLRRLSEFVPN
ncbi:MAG: EpsI family protein [Deltaproteobacteria bacterium]|nr:EpsI family protein [Deltaproteobacteria bacterium]